MTDCMCTAATTVRTYSCAFGFHTQNTRSAAAHGQPQRAAARPRTRSARLARPRGFGACTNRKHSVRFLHKHASTMLLCTMLLMRPSTTTKTTPKNMKKKTRHAAHLRPARALPPPPPPASRRTQTARYCATCACNTSWRTSASDPYWRLHVPSGNKSWVSISIHVIW